MDGAKSSSFFICFNHIFWGKRIDSLQILQAHLDLTREPFSEITVFVLPQGPAHCSQRAEAGLSASGVIFLLLVSSCLAADCE